MTISYQVATRHRHPISQGGSVTLPHRLDGKQQDLQDMLLQKNVETITYIMDVLSSTLTQIQWYLGGIAQCYILLEDNVTSQRIPTHMNLSRALE